MDILLYTGSAIIILWGISHLIPTKNVVKGFGDISTDNKRIITMEWIMEGILFLFIGILVILFFNTALISAFALIVMAIISAFTGARVNFLPYKLCPMVLTTTAVLYILGSLL